MVVGMGGGYGPFPRGKMEVLVSYHNEVNSLAAKSMVTIKIDIGLCITLQILWSHEFRAQNALCVFGTEEMMHRLDKNSYWKFNKSHDPRRFKQMDTHNFLCVRVTGEENRSEFKLMKDTP